jgi:MFS superfamily sulfate permease-like transporter
VQGQKLSRATVIVDAVTIVAVTVVAVLEDLAIAIGVGIVWNCLALTWIQSSTLSVHEGLPCDQPVVTVRGCVGRILVCLKVVCGGPDPCQDVCFVVPSGQVGELSRGVRGQSLVKVDVDGVETNPQPLDTANKTDKLLTRSPTADSGAVAEKQYTVTGNLFFANGHQLVDMFRVSTDPNDVELCLRKDAVLDADGWASVEQLMQLYGNAGKSLRLRFLQ